MSKEYIKLFKSFYENFRKCDIDFFSLCGILFKVLFDLDGVKYNDQL